MSKGGGAVDTQTPGSVGPRRLAIHYTLLALVTAGVFAFVFSAGASKHAQTQIAGGYDVSGAPGAAACLGPKIELTQSGRFVGISNATSTLSGTLTFVNARLTGSVHCVKGHSTRIEAHVANDVLSGSLGGLPVSAQQKRDPPEPGAPKPLVPGSIGGEYKLAPSSACLGGSIKLVQGGSTVKVVASKKPRGSLLYRAGVLAGVVSCQFGGRRAVSGTASGRALELIFAPPGAKSPAPGAAASPLDERISATKQRTFENTVVAFFIAVAVVMLFARLCGSLMPRIRQPRVMGEVLAGILLGPTAFGAIDPSLQASVFASDIVPYIGVAANLGLIFFMFLIEPGGRPRTTARARADDACGLEHGAAGAADARDADRAAAVHAAGAQHALCRVRPVRRRVDVDHGLSGAGQDHLRAAHAQAAAGRAGAVGGGRR